VTAVEEVQAAIEKLTALRNASSPAPWAVTHDSAGVSVLCNMGDSLSIPVVAVLSDEDGDDFNPDPGGADNDAYLIVTLHRTIDAQLVILQDFADRFAGRADSPWVPIAPAATNALALARAINGTPS